LHALLCKAMTKDNDDLPPLRKAVSEERQKWEKKFHVIRGFWRTKRAINAKVPLYDWPIDDLLSAGYLGPWRFNATQSAISGGIASLTINAINLIDDTKRIEVNSPPDLDPALASLWKITSGWVEPFLVPIYLMTLVYIIGWGSLRNKDSKPESRRRARNAYLYFDGAFGFYSQLYVSFALALFFTPQWQESISNVLTTNPFEMPFVTVFIISAVWQIDISSRRLPSLLFSINGYSLRRKQFWQAPKSNDPPRFRLNAALFVAGLPLLYIVYVALNLISLAFAMVIMWLRTALA